MLKHDPLVVCVSNVIMSPLTATLKCPHGRETLNGTEAVASVAHDEDGGGREDHLEGGRGEARCVLPAGETDSESDPGQRDEGSDPRESRSTVSPSSFGEAASKGIELGEGEIWGV